MEITVGEIFYYLNNSVNNLYVFEGFVIVIAVIIALRIIVCGGYQSQLTFFKLSGKDISERSHIKDTRSKLLDKVIKDYIKSSGKGVQSLNANQIVKKHMLSLNMLGWSYESIERIIAASSQGVLLIGILLMLLFTDFKYVYALSTIIAFLLLRIAESVFDYTTVKKKIEYEMTEYVNREVGQFYGTDSGSAIYRLKDGIAESIAKQSESLNSSITKLGDTTAGVLRLSLQEISKSLENAITNMSKIDDTMKEPVELWRTSLLEAKAVQQEMNGTCAMLNSMLTSISNNFAEQKEKDTFEKQLKYIERNQLMLEESINKYELSLEKMTQKMGDGFGGIIDFHVQKAYQSINEELAANMNQMINFNNDMILKLQEMFENMKQQSMAETQAILKIKDQLEFHFEK